jgi:16S rRNA processing protein RimM
MTWVSVGVITRTHGVRGQVYVRVDSDNPDRFSPSSRFRTNHERYGRLVVREARPGPHGLIVGFAGVTSIELAEELRGLELHIDASERRVLDDGEFWPDQLLGLEVRGPAGRIGTVERVQDGPQARLVIVTDDDQVGEVPFVEALVPVVNLQEGWLTVDLPEGLFNPR